MKDLVQQQKKEVKMKRYLLLLLTAIPLFAFTVNFIYCDYEEGEDDEYWYDDYWEPEPYYCDGYWVYYPHGYYCVYYVWYHPWWWDWYWWHCHWCHHFDWHFFCAGFYVVWYEDGCWWWRPRYGRVVRYKLPYAYSEFRYKARSYGVDLPDKPPREVNIPYNEKEIQRLTRDKDPQLYARLEKEQKSGNLDKIRREYETKVKKEIVAKNDEYRKTTVRNPAEGKYKTGKNMENKTIERRKSDSYYDPQEQDNDNSRIIKKSRDLNDEEDRRTINKSRDTSDEIDDEDNFIKRSANPRKSESPDNPEEYQSTRNTKMPIRNLPPTNKNEEKRRTTKNPSTQKTRR